VEFGAALRHWRQTAGLSLADLAREVHYSKGYLSKVETGMAQGSPQLAALCDDVLAAGGELTARIEEPAAPRPPDRHAESARLMIEHGLQVLVALDRAHTGLRRVARGNAGLDVSAAVQESGLHAAREHLLVSGSPTLVQAGEAVFRRLLDIRNVVGLGADLESAAYHRAYHAFSGALWKYRMSVRAELGQPSLSPAQLGLTDFSDRDRCRSCN
jgi:transcriptional regulator with XRE-family HTH domain